MDKQVYKLELFAKQRIYHVFHMSLIEQDTIKKERVNKFLKLKLELDAREYKKYKVKTIKNNAIYKEVIKSQLLGLYYLIF